MLPYTDKRINFKTTEVIKVDYLTAAFIGCREIDLRLGLLVSFAASMLSFSVSCEHSKRIYMPYGHITCTGLQQLLLIPILSHSRLPIPSSIPVSRLLFRFYSHHIPV